MEDIYEQRIIMFKHQDTFSHCSLFTCILYQPSKIDLVNDSRTGRRGCKKFAAWSAMQKTSKAHFPNLLCNKITYILQTDGLHFHLDLGHNTRDARTFLNTQK
jgi:hypothetical protein